MKQKATLLEKEDKFKVQLKQINGNIISLDNKEENEVLQKQLEEISKKQKEIQLKLIELRNKDIFVKEKDPKQSEEGSQEKER